MCWVGYLEWKGVLNCGENGGYAYRDVPARYRDQLPQPPPPTANLDPASNPPLLVRRVALYVADSFILHSIHLASPVNTATVHLMIQILFSQSMSYLISRVLASLRWVQRLKHNLKAAAQATHLLGHGITWLSGSSCPGSWPEAVTSPMASWIGWSRLSMQMTSKLMSVKILMPTRRWKSWMKQKSLALKMYSSMMDGMENSNSHNQYSYLRGRPWWKWKAILHREL